MAVTQVTVACPACAVEITCKLLLLVDTMPSGTTQEWRGGLSIDVAPIKTHLATHNTNPNAPAGASTK